MSTDPDHDHRTMAGGDPRLTRARRAGIAYLVAAIAALLAQITLGFALGPHSWVVGLFRGAWAILAILGFERLGWARGYRAGRTDEPERHRDAEELTTP